MKLTVVVGVADGTPDSAGTIHPLGSVVLPDGEVPVTLEFRRKDLTAYMGKARLRFHADTYIVADMDLLDSRIGATADGPSMLDILYPALGGAAQDVKGHVVGKFIVTDIGLSVSKNTDHRVLTIGKQLELTRN